MSELTKQMLIEERRKSKLFESRFDWKLELLWRVLLFVYEKIQNQNMKKGIVTNSSKSVPLDKDDPS